MNNGDGIRNDIYKAIGEVSDPGQKVVLTLMIRLLDMVDYKLESLMKDEKALKSMVLNGRADFHDDDHHFIAKLKAGIDPDKLIEIYKDREKNGGLCYYASSKIEEEKENKKSTRHIRDEVLSKVVYSLLSFASGAVVLEIMHFKGII